MKQELGQTSLIGEVVATEEQVNCIRDLLSGITYETPSKQCYSALIPGEVVKFSVTNKDVTEVISLATANTAKARLYKLAAEKQRTPFFSPSIQVEVNQIVSNPGLEDPALTNFEALAFCSIDGIGTMDLDQALYVEKTDTGFIVKYAIADAAYYIKPGTALFNEALERAASYYLPGLMIPMLPRQLCLDVISLNENVKRRAVVFELILDHEGRLQHTNIIRALIRSRGKLSFKEVQTFLSDRTGLICNDAALSTSLKYFEEVGRLRLKLAEERNVARYHRTEVTIKLGQDGLIFNLLDNVRNEVELYNEQLSLLCNTAGALLLAEHDGAKKGLTQPIYKIHPPPTEEKLQAFEAAIDQLIQLHDLETTQWQWRHHGSQTLSEYLKTLPHTGPFARVARAIHRQAIMVNTRSSFSEQPKRHYGVGAEVYARFSSPMREIVGVFLHKELLEKMCGIDANHTEQQDEILRDQVMLAANRAKDIQRQLTNEANLLVLDQICSADLEQPKSKRPVRKGTVIGLGRDKLYILLDDISIEIKLYIRPLEVLWGKKLYIDQKQLSLYVKGEQQLLVSLGDEIEIVVVEMDQDHHQWIFSILSV